MLARCLTTCFALLALAAEGKAQSPNTSPRPFVPVQDPGAPLKAEAPLFLRSMGESKSADSGQQPASSPLKECPMPVHRPDTSRLERMRVARPSPDVSYSMPRIELRCLNPLDPQK
jgi:hypothetical protein